MQKVGRIGQGRVGQDRSAQAWHNSIRRGANTNTQYSHLCTAVMSNSVYTLSDLSSESDQKFEIREQMLL